MRIAVDAMGGDHAPAGILAGAVEALSLLEPTDQLILVGTEEVIRSHIGGALEHHANLLIEPSTQVVTMDDSPVEVIRHKKDSSLVRMVRLAKEGKVDAIISAGNTGALVAAGVMMLKPLPGVDRPGIAVTIPTRKGVVMLCDAGANTQPKPTHLHQYAVMASFYMQLVAGIERPSVGVLNIGTEEEKGTPLVKEARELIKGDASLNFIGYVEGRDIPNHPCDVLITDGFTGNVALKIIEGCMAGIMHHIQREVAKESPELAVALKAPMGRVLKAYDHEEYGGALLLGVQGLFLKVHGSGGPRAIKNAVATARSALKLDVNHKIAEHLAGQG